MKSMGKDSRIGPASTSCFTSRSWRTEGGGEEEDESQREVRQVASSGRRRGRLGGVTDGRETGIGLHDGKHSGGELRESSAPLLRRAAQGEGRWVYDRWGPCVRKFLYLNPNFWIVTILPPKRNLVPRFRRKMPNQKEVGNSYTLV